MTTYNWTATPYHTTNATFRTWGSSIGTALAAIGLVKTSDTGQINWTTVTMPAASAYGGYEIWRFNDASQTTYPLFFRIDYGTSSTTSYGTIKVTLGKGSSGAGVITSVIQSELQSGAHFQTSGGSCYASTSTSGFSLYVAPGTGSIGFTIERSLDSTGSPTGNGVALIRSEANTGSPSPNWHVYSYADPASTVLGFSPMQLPILWSGATFSSTSSLSKDGAIAPVFPLALACTGVPPWISKQLVAIAPADAGVYTASPHGTSHTYRGFSFLGYTCPVTAQAVSAYSVPAGIYWE